MAVFVLFAMVAILAGCDSPAVETEQGKASCENEVFLRYSPPLIPSELIAIDPYGVADLRLLAVGIIAGDSTFHLKRLIRLEELSLLPTALSTEESRNIWEALERSVRTASTRWIVRYQKEFEKRIGTLYLIISFRSESDSHAASVKSYFIDAAALECPS